MINKKNCLGVIGLVFILCLTFASSGSAAPAPYSFTLNHFILTGNIPGSVIDDFTGPALDTSKWEVEDPTITMTGSSVVFSNPSAIDHINFGSVNVQSARSGIGSQFLMYDTAGNYTATSTWAPDMPELNQLFVMDISSVGVEPNEIIAIGVSNFDSSVADFFGIPSGPAVFLGWIRDMENGEFAFQGHSFIPGQDEIVLQLYFDDLANEFTGSFSVDGNNNLTSPFSAIPSSGELLLASGAEVTLGGESWEVVPIPSSFLLLFFGLAGLVFKRRSSGRGPVAGSDQARSLSIKGLN